MLRHLLIRVALCTAISLYGMSANADTINPDKVCPKAATTVGSVKVDARQVCTLLVVVQNTLNKLEDKLRDPARPELKSVNLTVKAASESSGGLSISLFVLQFGQSTTASSIQTLNISLAPKKEIAVAAATAQPFSSTLANAIEAALVAIDLSGIDLTTEELSLSVKFGVKRVASGGATGQLQLVPITLSVSGSATSDNTQELIFKFGKKGETKKNS